MIFYLIELLLIISIKLLFKYRLKSPNGKIIEGKDAFLGMSFVILFVTMALRGATVGSDTSTYMDIFNKIARSNSFGEAMEVSTISSAPIYVGMHYVLSRFIKFTQISVVVNSAIIAIGFYYYIKKESSNYFDSVFLLYTLTLFFECMNGTRQFMAISLALNSYVLLKENIKSLKGWTIFFIALGFHNTIVAFGIAILGILFKNKMKSKEKAIFMSACFSAAITVGFTTAINLVTAIFPYFQIYINGENKAQMFSSVGNGRISILFIFLIFVIIGWIILNKRNSKAQNIDYVDLMNCLFCGFAGTIFATNILFIRILWPFMCIYIVFFPNIIHTMSVKKRRFFHVVIMGVLLTYCILFLVEDKSGIIPYRLFWG